MKMRPLHDRLLVKRIAEEEKTKGGLIIPDTAREKPTEARVIAVGEGKVLDDGKLRPLDVRAGDRVLFGKYSGTEIQHLGDEHLIIREDDFLAVLRTPVSGSCAVSTSWRTPCASRSARAAAT